MLNIVILTESIILTDTTCFIFKIKNTNLLDNIFFMTLLINLMLSRINELSRI